MNRPHMIDFLSSHSSPEKVVSIRTEPEPIYIEEGRDALDFVILGEDGNLSKLEAGSHHKNYDFHFKDVGQFYTHGVCVYAPGEGVVVDVVNGLDDLYDRSFDFDGAVQNDQIRDLAGNYVIIQHNSAEFSHLFHLLKGSIQVSIGQQVQAGEKIGKIGFYGAANLYSHLHYQLMNGKDFLKDCALPCKFSNATLIENGQPKHYPAIALDTSDFILNEKERDH